MGCSCLSLSSSIHDPNKDKGQVSFVTKGANPNPYNFTIKQGVDIGKFTVVLVHYPDAKNFEGDKILVYKGFRLKTISAEKCLDPHFFNTGIHPVARFVPTIEGWDMAIQMVKYLSSKN